MHPQRGIKGRFSTPFLSSLATPAKDAAVIGSPRHHHLDALRATAMLLGIVMHGLLSFFANPYWPAQDLQQHEAYEFANQAIHGFRMPLFFLISGYFTTMLWRRKGLGALLLHRVKRILLPLVVGGIIIIPLVWVADSLGKNFQVGPQRTAGETTFWTALHEGNIAQLTQELEQGADPDQTDRADQSALMVAAWYNQIECAETLLEFGAAPNQPEEGGHTALHTAAFLGRTEIAKLLLAKGAQVNIRSREGKTPLDSLRESWTTVQIISGMLNVTVDRDEVQSGRKQLEPILIENGATARGPTTELTELKGLYMDLTMFPLTAHLWFLYYLLMLVAGFALATLTLKALGTPSLPAWLLRPPVALFALVPLTACAQYFMTQSFGPDTAMGILPWPPKLLYYAIFFGYGAVCFGRPEFEDQAGRWWPFLLVAAVPLGVYGIHLFQQVPVGEQRVVYSLCAALFAWVMILAFIGLFRSFFSRENKGVRFVSDASYWMYLAHLPLVMMLQALISRWNLPSPLKLTLLCLVTFAFLLLTYRYLVRYTLIGTMLNGRKLHPSKLPPPAPLASPGA